MDSNAINKANDIFCFIGVKGPGVVVANTNEAWKIIETQPVKGIFVSVLSEGLSIFINKLKTDIRFQTIPVALVGNQDPIFYNIGFDECYTSSYNNYLLSISEQDIIHFNIRSNQQKQRWLDANTDSLTGCYIRKYFDAVISQQILNFKRNNITTSLIIIDIDDFKKINDTYGHQIGDHVLRQLGALLREYTRPTDIVCRYGGDEFGIILPQQGADEAFKVAERIRLKWQENKIHINDITISSTLSAGVSSISIETKTSEELIKNADMALYKSKKNGKNMVQKDVKKNQFFRF